MAEQELFNLVEIREDLYGYFVDRDLNVWSTKKGPTPVKISPSWGPQGRTGTTLRERLMDCKAFVRFLNDAPKRSSTNLYFVAVLADSDGAPMFSSKPKAHLDESSARIECERLARLNPGSSFAYFRCIGVCSAQEIQWS